MFFNIKTSNYDSFHSKKKGHVLCRSFINYVNGRGSPCCNTRAKGVVHRGVTKGGIGSEIPQHFVV